MLGAIEQKPIDKFDMHDQVLNMDGGCMAHYINVNPSDRQV